jgi:hypothetical protein
MIAPIREPEQPIPSVSEQCRLFMLKHPTREAAPEVEHFRSMFVTHRYVYPQAGCVIQLAALVQAPSREYAGWATRVGILPPRMDRDRPDGIRVPASMKEHLPPLSGHGVLVVERPHEIEWFAKFYLRLTALTIPECVHGRDLGDDEMPDPDFIVLAFDDDRVIGVAQAQEFSTPVLVIKSHAEGIDPKDVMFVPYAKDVDVPVVKYVWVAANHRRQGVATTLLNHVSSRWERPP